jgi:hypothetical protein
MPATSEPAIDRPAIDTATADDKPQPHRASFVVEVRTRGQAPSDGAIEILMEKLNAAFQDSQFDITIIPTPESPAEVPQGAEKRGEALLVAWTQDGTLVDGGQIEKAWGVKRQTVDAARERGEIFSIWVKNKHWYPREALHLKRSELAEINCALDDIDPSSKLLFLLRQHGALGGRTAADAVAAGQLSDVLRLAADWVRA